MNRREFCKHSLALGAAVAGASVFGWHNLVAHAAPAAVPDLVAVRNGEPDVMFDKAIEALGGIGQFVKKGQSVVVKPNIGWNRPPELGANTNPLLVKRIVEHCIQAGAQKVYVFDNAVDSGVKAYKTSGIEEAAKAGGAIVVPGHSASSYVDVEIPDAEKLKTTQVHELLMDTDVLINVPVLKHHFASQMTIAMKNLMGVVFDRRAYHRKGLNDCIVDFCLHRKPDLNIVDAYRVTMANGPQNARPDDVLLKKMLLASTDIVAVDAAAIKVFGKEPDSIQHVKMGHERGMGTMNLDELNIKKIDA
jgi:uncharacterized protein (DUF362 family)